ncbi:hypothetical protein F2Q70_00007284 [Brassica cretica]|uniref:Uncharacterized protein n=1 Tax=Brassica cretica TaxID=69181 RepID=A0A8S9M199_BRACR|nr:hypothetical protein F2Q70_00007284 [Brassica cretica]
MWGLSIYSHKSRIHGGWLIFSHVIYLLAPGLSSSSAALHLLESQTPVLVRLAIAISAFRCAQLPLLHQSQVLKPGIECFLVADLNFINDVARIFEFSSAVLHWLFSKHISLLLLRNPISALYGHKWLEFRLLDTATVCHTNKLLRPGLIILVYLTGRVSPDRYRFIRQESVLELSQRRDRNPYGSGVLRSTLFQPALSSNGSRALLGKTRKGGAGRWVVLGVGTTVLHLNVDTDRGVSDWLHRVPTQS